MYKRQSVYPYITEKRIGYKITNEENPDKSKTFTVSLRKFSEKNYYVNKERLNECFVEACRSADQLFFIRIKSDADYLSMKKKVRWSSLFRKYLVENNVREGMDKSSVVHLLGSAKEVREKLKPKVKNLSIEKKLSTWFKPVLTSSSIGFKLCLNKIEPIEITIPLNLHTKGRHWAYTNKLVNIYACLLYTSPSPRD